MTEFKVDKSEVLVIGLSSVFLRFAFVPMFQRRFQIFQSTFIATGRSPTSSKGV